MKKTLYIVVLCLFTAFAIIFGTVRVIRDTTRDFFNFSGWPKVFSNVSGESEVGDAGLEEFSSIDIDADVASVKIVYGSENKIEYDCSKELIPTYSVENNTLVVKQKNNVHTLFGNSKAKIVITVKDKTVLNRIKIESSVGNVNIKDIVVNELDVDCSVGNIELKKVDVEKLWAKADVGNIDISIKEKLDTYNVDISADVGNVKFDGNKVKSSFTQIADSDKTISIEADCGNIKVD